MSFLPHAALRCPLDGLTLEHQGDRLCCINQHSFDIARQGYVNLLGAQDKRSRDPGDSKEMVAARHRFLEANHYQPIADRVASLLQPQLGSNPLVVDAGCGEGYYLQHIRRHLAKVGQADIHMLGFDISKWAVQCAARRFPASWLVATNRNIPLADACADVVMDIFGFANFAAFARVLKPSGLLARVQAGNNHLLELRQMIYPEVKVKDVVAQDPPGFSLISSVQVSYETLCLGQAAIGDLLLMTPHLYRASSQGKERVTALRELAFTVDASIDIFQKI